MFIQCQRSVGLMMREAAAPGVRSACPGGGACAGGETYEVVAGADHSLLADAIRFVGEEFGVATQFETLLIRGERPQTVLRGGAPHVYVGRDSSAYQLRYQLGHEAFHAACGPEVIHWVHEMLAEHASVQWMLKDPFSASYATEVNDGNLVRTTDAGRRALPTRGDVQVADYPDAYATGHNVISTVGWDGLRKLPRYFGGGGVPDVQAWTDEFEESVRPILLRLMGG